jgi:AraC-like DNA-binding protein
LSQQLGTTRHNTSQVINEHFDMNFFELVNTYRIKEAQEMLQDDKNSNLTIIQIAYEVGFNNKVTFNKSFKKQLSLTPSQYIKSLRA